MSSPYADDGLTTPQTAPALDDNALTTPHMPGLDMGMTTPQAPLSEPLPVALWPSTSPYMPDGQSLPPPPPLRARRGLVRVGITVASLVALLALVAGIAFAASHHSGGVAGVSDSPANAAGSYCRALQRAQYPQGYTLWGTALTSTIPSADYAAISKEMDTQVGAVTGCVVGKVTTSGGTATVPVTLTRGSAGAQTLTWQFSKSGSGWQLSQYPEPVLAARATLRHYCTAVVGGQYSAAYALFAPALQQKLLSAEVYTSVASEADAAAGKATACATTSVDLATDGTATGHLSLARKAGDDETMSLAAATTGPATITVAPDVSLPSRVTARTFCTALVKKDYNTAFAQFTPSAQAAIGSANDFGNRIRQATILTGDITSCSAGAFTLNADNQSGTLGGQVKTHPFFGDQTHNIILTMVANASDLNAWLIDDATIDGVSLSGGFPFVDGGGNGDGNRFIGVSRVIGTTQARGVCSNRVSSHAGRHHHAKPAAMCRMESSSL
jgi:hypothetical protein